MVLIDREAAGRYVLSRRTAEGGYCFYRTPQWGVEEPNAPDTLAALGSLRLLGIAAPAPQATGRWVHALQSLPQRQLFDVDDRLGCGAGA